jgi:hypothetical protein
LHLAAYSFSGCPRLSEARIRPDLGGLPNQGRAL